MTTIVAVAVAGSVYMAADACSNVYERPVIGIRKIARLPVGDEEVLLAFCGAAGLCDLVPTGLVLESAPEQGTDPHRWVYAVARGISELAVEAGLVDEGKLDGGVMLGFRGRLWTLSHSTALAHPDGRAALGSGEGPAIGALDALLDAGVSPQTAVHKAAEIACRRDRYSEPPIQVEVLPPPVEKAAS